MMMRAISLAVLFASRAAARRACRRAAARCVLVADFKEGGAQLEDVEKPGLPARGVLANREFFFYEGMKIDVGPTQRDYSEAHEFKDASKRWQKEAKLGRDGALVGFVAGQPFPTETIDCKGDPEAATKIIWNFTKAWNGSGRSGSSQLLGPGEQPCTTRAAQACSAQRVERAPRCGRLSNE
jgi:hypothetical protein